MLRETLTRRSSERCLDTEFIAGFDDGLLLRDDVHDETCGW